MAGNKKPRKKYVPREVIIDTMNWVKVGMQPATSIPDIVTDIKLQLHIALLSLKEGTALRSNVINLSHALITAQSIADRTVGDDHRQTLDNGQLALLAIARRYDKWGKVQATSLELDDLILAIDVHDAQIDMCTVDEVTSAIKAAKVAIKCGHYNRELSRR